MKVFLMLLLVAGFAHGTNQEPKTGVTQNQAQHQSQSQKSQQKQSANSNSVSDAISDSNSSSDSISDSESISDSSSSSDNDLNIRYPRDRRQAPAVGLVAPVPAIGQKCIGWGGSNETGATVLGYCWKQRDDWSFARAKHLASLGLYSDAARAYCKQRVHREDFPKGQCKAMYEQGLRTQHRSTQPVINVRIDVEDKVCEIDADSDIVVREYLDTTGMPTLFDCKQRPAKSG